MARATIETTGNHPFFVDGAGFVRADSLGIGSQIVTRAGPNLVVQSIAKKTGTVAVYNFVVEDFHSYFVGNPGLTGGGAWVHNAGPECTEIAEFMQSRLTRAGRGVGKIIRVEVDPSFGKGTTLHPEAGYEKFRDMWGHHDVLLHDGKIYDPMMEGVAGAKAWVDHADWLKRWGDGLHVFREL